MIARRDFLGTMLLAPLVALVQGKPKVKWHHVAGVFGNSTHVAWVDGKKVQTAEYAIWNRALEDWEIVALSKGVSPLHFPKGLQQYSPQGGTRQ